MYKLYIQKRPEDLRDMNSRFYLRPLDNPKDDVWYSHQPLVRVLVVLSEM
jgi:hypothetical protein